MHRSLFDSVKERLAARPDTEHHQAILRLVIGTAAGITLMLHWDGILERGAALKVVAGLCLFYGLALGILASICFGPTNSIPRRYLGIIADVSFVTTTLVLGQDPSTQGLVMIYLWIILGNGLRFGQKYLVVALLLSLIGFVILFHSVPFWREHQWLFAEILIGQVLVALYMRALVVRLNTALDREAAASNAKSIFVSRMSHEMRTPLNAVLGSIDLALENKLGQKAQKELLGNAQRSALHLRGLISDVLDFSKMDADKLELESIEVNLRELLWSTAKMLQPQAQEKGVGIDVHIESGVPENVYTDPLRLRQVFINLVGNALKFTHEGYVRLEAYVFERESSERVTVRFAVRDTGIGIPKDKLGTIFESFKQADERVTREYGGTGLGLTISQHLVQLMGGEIRVESVVDSGSVFSFTIPLKTEPLAEITRPMWALVGMNGGEIDVVGNALDSWGMTHCAYPNVATLDKSNMRYSGLIVKTQFKKEVHEARTACRAKGTTLVIASSKENLLDDSVLVDVPRLSLPFDRFKLFSCVSLNATALRIAADTVQHAEIEEPITAQFETKLHVLIIDDTPSNLLIGRASVESAGHSCDTVDCAESALDLLAAHRYDAIVCDRNMPGMDGAALIREWRHIEAMDGRAARTPVIMLTGDATEKARAEAVEAGADAFITKPIRPI
ncbi:MAG TPA: ATP-binding protein, partial [Burkholderiales bacterium]|nr:ATP-binding protein [Burkholderiales bacterium]